MDLTNFQAQLEALPEMRGRDYYRVRWKRPVEPGVEGEDGVHATGGPRADETRPGRQTEAGMTAEQRESVVLEGLERAALAQSGLAAGGVATTPSGKGNEFVNSLADVLEAAQVFSSAAQARSFRRDFEQQHAQVLMRLSVEDAEDICRLLADLER